MNRALRITRTDDSRPLVPSDGHDVNTAMAEAEHRARSQREVLLEIGPRRFLVRAAEPGRRQTCSRCGMRADLTFGWPASSEHLCPRCSRAVVCGMSSPPAPPGD